MNGQIFSVPETQPVLTYHPLPGPKSIVLRDGKCCDKYSLIIYASQYQTYAECENCQCRCVHPGQDDGQTTCWTHHDCSRGDCTHQDVDDEPAPVEADNEW